jgi:Concanavalin A-like lectin/glucanases superfamily
MNRQDSKDTLDGLLERLCIEELAEDELQQIAAKISEDEQALRSYIEAVHWQQSIGYLVGGGSRPEHPVLPLVDETMIEEFDHDSSRPLGKSVDSTSARGSTQWFQGRLPGFVGSWAIAASAAFLAGVGITSIALRRPAEQPAPIAATPKDKRSIAFAPPSPFIQESQLGKVSGLSLEASSDGLLRSLQVGQELRCGEVVQLTSGYMRVALNSGPELIIEGPAEFSIIGKDSVFVRVGRVAASGAEKLLLQSPLLTAECNDAEVLFIAEEDTSTNVYAYKGVVTMRSIAQPQASNEKLRVLHEGQGVNVQPETTTATLSQLAMAPPSDFVRSWAEVEAGLTESQRLVLSDRPIAYWPLHRVRRNRRVLDLTQHGFDGQAIGNWPAELSDASAKDEPGALFNGESYIEPDRKPPIDLRTGFTVEGWAKVSGGPAFQSIFTSRWVLDTHTPHRQCLGFTLYAGDNDRWQFWTGNGRYGELWDELHTDAVVVRNRWTHVVASFEPEEPTNGMPAESLKGIVRIYVDGQQVAQDVHEMSLMDFEWPARIGAAEFVPNSLTAWLFRGSLRDIAVYDYPLEPARIQAHYDAGKEAG